MNRLQQLASHGQSIWLDFTRRSFVENGALRKLIEEDALTGVTSNPTIFDEAISRGDEYEMAIQQAAKRGLPAEEAFEEIAIADIQQVADELRPVFEHTKGDDGYVSFEVSPHLAHDTAGSIAQAREFWTRIDRPNVFIKIPAATEGLPAIRALIAEGINVNITLLFGLVRYRAVAEAFMSGLEDRLAVGGAIDRVVSVASFFLSRIDLMVDPLLDEIGRGSAELAERAQALHGKAAIACAKQAYQIYNDTFGSKRFLSLAGVGARSQRVLWASTSTKRPDERDVRYVEALIGANTINTMPLKTLEAFRDHGDPAPRLEEDLDDVRTTLRELGEIGISLDAVARKLEEEGCENSTSHSTTFTSNSRASWAKVPPPIANSKRGCLWRPIKKCSRLRTSNGGAAVGEPVFHRRGQRREYEDQNRESQTAEPESAAGHRCDVVERRCATSSDEEHDERPGEQTWPHEKSEQHERPHGNSADRSTNA